MIKHQFVKKVFTPKGYARDILFLLGHFLKIIRAFGNKKISKIFREKIMSVSTAVNGCVYCEWFHAKQAVSSGISEEEIRDILNLQFQANASAFEVPALLYTQHFAETSQDPDAEMTRQFTDYYGRRTADDIYVFIRIIYFGNLTGNTWDAVLSRFKGDPAPDSRIWFELIFFLLNFIFMFPAMLLMWMDEKRKNRKKTKL